MAADDPHDSVMTLVEALAIAKLMPFVNRSGTDAERYQLLLELKPREGDVERVFLPSKLEQARALYTAMWSAPPPLVPRPGANRLWIRTAATEDFAEWTRRGREFPGGYRPLAEHLQPGLAWVAWKFVEQGETTGLSFDGLVRLDDRFVWFPQPWRLVPVGSSPSAPSGAGSGPHN